MRLHCVLRVNSTTDLAESVVIYIVAHIGAGRGRTIGGMHSAVWQHWTVVRHGPHFDDCTRRILRNALKVRT